MIDVGTARKQGEAMLAAAEASPVRQFRYELRRRGKEWARAAEEFGLVEGDCAAIELVGSVCPGMFVLDTSSDYGDHWRPVIRCFESRGQWSIHYQGADGRDRYDNFYGATSPTVVKA